jgi:hypothetical protein
MMMRPWYSIRRTAKIAKNDLTRMPFYRDEGFEIITF